MRSSCNTAERMKPDRDSLDEFFEYEAEDFLVYLGLLITEGRTPEFSVKGRTEGLHCPPAQSSQPGPNKHECSDKLAPCRRARKTRSEVTLLWKNNIPIMVEVMLLPDCCYSDEGSGTEGNDLTDPAMKQDALLLERWTLEPVPRQSGDRFIEEKTLLLAVRSYVFFSQLSAWLSVSHGAVPRNILYRVSPADGELQWNFTHTPTVHMFPVPNVSHNVALKVSVQSLPRQSNYPVLNCSIHSNLGFYEKRFSMHEQIVPHARELKENSQYGVLHSQHTCSKQTWTVGPEGLLQARTSLSMNLTIPARSLKLLSGGGGSGYDIGTSPSKVQGFSTIGESKGVPPDSPVRSFKALSLVDTPNNPHTNQPSETNPLIGTLIQERQEVIARIAQHLLQCDPANTHIANRSLKLHDSSTICSKIFRNQSEDENFNKIERETPVINTLSSDLTLTPDNLDRKLKPSLDTPITSSRHSLEGRTSPKPQARRKLILIQPSEQGSNSFLSSASKHAPPALSVSTKENSVTLPERGDFKQSEQTETNTCKVAHIAHHSTTNVHMCSSSNNNKQTENRKDDSSQNDFRKNCLRNVVALKTCGVSQTSETKCIEGNTRKAQGSDHSNQLHSIENYVSSDREGLKLRETQDKLKTSHDENEDPAKCDCTAQEQGRANWTCLRCERLKNKEQTKSGPLRTFNNWRKKGFHSLDGTSTKAFHPCTGLPLLSSPVPQRKTQSGYFDLDTSLLQFKGLSKRRQRHCEKKEGVVCSTDRQLSCSAPPAPCLSLLGNFEESVLNYRFEPLGTVEGFTADVGASGVFCPTHMILPVKVSFYSVSDDNAPSPYMGYITLESLGKRGYRIPPSGTIQVTLFNPNKTVVKMFVVKYDLQDMPANHQTFLRQRTFSVPVNRDKKGTYPENNMKTEEQTLRYLIHLRFQSSKSGKIYLYRDVRLLFSRKSMEVDSGAAYELKSYIETPTNPQFSPRC
ncbi:PREDICTED: protein FAM214A [Nanorana parkeri]|uniref:protein FAM214A n=1 Tax=Nanorana parkeri TaxID=125878 RepID=UPI000854A503|nr:PREDICTED: protein FAM214A [Nanorana parkeri]